MQDALLVTAGSLSEQRDARSLPVGDVLDIMRLMVRGEPLDELLQRIVDVIAFSCNIKRVTLGIIDDRTGMFTPVALHGYPVEQSLSIKRHGYTFARMRSELRPEFKIGRSCYYVRAEDQNMAYDDQYDYIMDVELIDSVRKSPSDWHELDFIDFLMIDRLGNWIGWIEIDEPGDWRVPSPEVIDHIQVLTDLAAIALENSRICGDAMAAIFDSKGYLHLIVNDIGDLVNDLDSKLSSLATEEGRESARKQAKLARETTAALRAVVENVRKFADVKESEPPMLEPYDLSEVLTTASDITRKEHPSRQIEINIDTPPSVSEVMADDLIYDLVCNLLRNAVRCTPSHKVEIDMSLFEGHSVCTVAIADRGVGIPDSMKPKAFAMFCLVPEGSIENRLMLTTVSLLVERYNGLINVRDRIPGDYSRGTCFEVSFPKILRPSNGNGGLHEAHEQARLL